MAASKAGLDAPPKGFEDPPDKSLGEFSELLPNYDGSYKPARMGLRKALDSGALRNPLKMQQSSTPWSARRPLSAGPTPRPRVQSASRTRREFQLPGGSIAERGPELLMPQRIELPNYLNTPARRPDGDPLPPEERTQTMRRIQDLELLTFACRRAAKVREEGRAHFSLGVLRDNLGQHRKAAECYNSFLRVCQECGDGQGCALAYHCIAVDHQLLGNSSADTTAKQELLRKAILYHNKHRESSDLVGRFIAHLNMGLAYAQLGEKEASTVNHQYALRHALQLHSPEGQSLAIGSLSFSSGMYENDPEKMKQLVGRYVELCSALKQSKNQASALKKLGILASQQGDNDQSINYFQQAIDCARAQGDREAEKDCSVRLGIAAGQAKMAEHLSNILQRSVVRGEHG